MDTTLNNNLPNKSSLASRNKSTTNMSVRFQMDDSNIIEENLRTKGPTRKQAAEASFVHEIRSWSSLSDALTNEQILTDTTSQSSDKNLTNNLEFYQKNLQRSSSTNQERSNRYRSPLIDRNRRYGFRQSKLKWRSFLGTMPEIYYIFTYKRFLRGLSFLQILIIFIDSFLRGISQIMFANNPLSGLIIIIALFIGNWQLALYGLLGTIISTLTAYFIGLDYGSIRSGLYSYNGCLIGLSISYYSFQLNSIQICFPIVLMSICSTIFFVSLCKIFVTRFDLSPFTFSYQLCSFLWLLASLKFQNFPINQTYLSINSFSSIIQKSNLTNETFSEYTILDILSGSILSISQIYFLKNYLSGILILIALSICSIRLTILALCGALTGQLSSAYLFGLPLDEVSKGLWSYNCVLTCQALGGMFFVLNGYHIWLYTFFGSLLTIIVQSAMINLLSSIGLSPLLFPSTLICWLFCLMAGSNRKMIAVKLQSISTPEDHGRRFRLSSLVKMHFEFVNDLSTILEKAGGNESIPIEDLATIENEFVPILLCSYAHQNDRKNLQALLEEGADVNSTDYDLRSPLHLAACDGNTDLCFMLIENYHANANQLDDFGGTPLYDAFCHGNFHIIPYLYSKGARMPISKTEELTFYLCAFSFEGNLEVVQYLIACGINPNLTDYNGRTALHLAVCGNHYDVVKYLVEESNASLTITDYYGQTPIDDAQRLNDQDILLYLQHLRNDLSRQQIRVLNIPLKDFLKSDDIDHQEILNENEEINENSLTTVEESLLPALFCTAAAEGNVRQMTNILEQFPEFRADSVDYDFRSAAHVAAAEGQKVSIQFLCKNSYAKKQDLHWIHREDRWGFTPIEEAYRYGHYEVANYLKELQTNDSNLNSSSQIEQQPLTTTTTTIRIKNQSFVDSIRKWKKILRFATLASKNESELIKGLLESGVFSSSEFYADYDGRTPMHWAAVNGHFDVVKMLQQYGDDGKTHRDRWGNSPLDEANRKKFAQIIHLLIDDMV